MVVLVINKNNVLLSLLLLSLVPTRKRIPYGHAGKEVEHEEIDEYCQIALEAEHIETEQAGDTHIRHERYAIENELNGLSHCHFTYCHNLRVYKMKRNG